MQTRVLKVKEILGCGIHRAYEIVNQDDFLKLKIGKHYYILEEEFHKWLLMYSGKEYLL